MRRKRRQFERSCIRIPLSGVGEGSVVDMAVELDGSSEPSSSAKFTSIICKTLLIVVFLLVGFESMDGFMALD